MSAAAPPASPFRRSPAARSSRGRCSTSPTRATPRSSSRWRSASSSPAWSRRAPTPTPGGAAGSSSPTSSSLLLSPIVGAMADESGRKKLFLFATYLLCVGGTAALWFVDARATVQSPWRWLVRDLQHRLLVRREPDGGLPARDLDAGDGRADLRLRLGAGLLRRARFAAAHQVDDRRRLHAREPARPARSSGRSRRSSSSSPRCRRSSSCASARRAGASRSLYYARQGFGRLRRRSRSIGHFRELAKFLAVFFVYSSGLMSIIAFVGVYAERTVGFSSSELISALPGRADLVGRRRLRFRRHPGPAGRPAERSSSRSLLWICHLRRGLLHREQARLLGDRAHRRSRHRFAAVGLAGPGRDCSRRSARAASSSAFWGLAGKGAYAVGPLDLRARFVVDGVAARGDPRHRGLLPARTRRHVRGRRAQRDRGRGELERADRTGRR